VFPIYTLMGSIEMNYQAYLNIQFKQHFEQNTCEILLI